MENSGAMKDMRVNDSDGWRIALGELAIPIRVVGIRRRDGAGGIEMRYLLVAQAPAGCTQVLAQLFLVARADRGRSIQ